MFSQKTSKSQPKINSYIFTFCVWLLLMTLLKTAQPTQTTTKVKRLAQCLFATAPFDHGRFQINPNPKYCMTFAVLLSEGFDLNSSYEASIFFGQDIPSARAYAQSRTNTPPPIPTVPRNNTFQFQNVQKPAEITIQIILDDDDKLRSYLHSFEIEILKTKEMTIIELVHIMYPNPSHSQTIQGFEPATSHLRSQRLAN